MSVLRITTPDCTVHIANAPVRKRTWRAIKRILVHQELWLPASERDLLFNVPMTSKADFEFKPVSSEIVMSSCDMSLLDLFAWGKILFPL
jgi:hypothetical protein